MAPSVAALLLAYWAPFWEGDATSALTLKNTELYCVFGAYPLALILGIPTYCICRFTNVRTTWLNCAIAGTGIAGIPSFLIELLMTTSWSPGDIARENGHDLIVNGHATLWAWRYGLISVSQISACGFIGGLVFWLVTFTRAVKGVEPRAERQL
jgi:hypothetical protein